uniref:Uncharacterized protein n=1 Tax=Arundo donax TaxID=35708 RepID=A0A0A9HBU3_ARUDO
MGFYLRRHHGLCSVLSSLSCLASIIC